MDVIADLHVHSRFAMACSKNITIKGLEASAIEKGINLIGTGDFTHPEWLAEIKRDLESVGNTGLYKVKGSNSGVFFMLSVEISTVFSDNHGKVKKIHNCVLMKDIEKVEELNEKLSKYGKLSSDGRAVLSMSAAELVDNIISVDKTAFVFPAHAWTPWFGVFGSISGFDSMEEAYQDREKYIYALETGLSSDPGMNWRISSLDKYALISNSDMHSLQKLGREANMFNLEKLSFDSVINAIKEKDVHKFKRTLEFYPEEGKYHYDGHRNCNFSIDPAKEKSEICPVCKKKMTIGVLHRVDEFADRPEGYVPKGSIPYTHIIPLVEIIAYATKKNSYSKVVAELRNNLLQQFKTEFNVLLDANIDDIKNFSNADIAQAIDNVRSNKVEIFPGYDGVFGKIELLGNGKKVKPPPKITPKQHSLSDF